MKIKVFARMTVRNRDLNHHPTPDVVLVGAGLIGLAIALELHARGASVVVLERGQALAGASIAAAGMLAVDDPHNPPELHPLSQLSASLYPGFLRRIEDLSGIAVPFQTATTVQYLPDGAAIRLSERSLDPRQLATALLSALRNTPIQILEHTRIASVSETKTPGETTSCLCIETNHGPRFHAKAVVYAGGAWTSQIAADLHLEPIPVTPRKGQMLRVRLPATLALQEVHRDENVYIVPRLHGPQAGTALIGATLEDAGFDTTVRPGDLRRLRALAAHLLPALASEADAPLVESWAGLRPVTPDGLPVLGALTNPRHLMASGHYRNGILLAPATASVLCDLIEKKAPQIDISAFSPKRLSPHEAIV